MGWQSTPYTWPLLVAALATGALTAFAVRRRRVPGAPLFAVVTGLLTLWSAGYALELASTSLDAQMAWLQARYVGVMLMPPAWLFFCARYTGHTTWLRRGVVAAILAITALSWAVMLTNGVHGLFWTGVRLSTISGLLKWTADLGPGYWANVVWAYGLLTVGNVLMLDALARSPRVHRGQAICLLVAVGVPWAANALYQLGWQPLGFVDPTPPAFTVSLMVMGWALFRYGFLQLVPIARHAVFDGMGDAVLVLDPAGRIVDMNPSARALAGTDAVGLPVSDVLGSWPLPRGEARWPELARTVDGAERVLEVRTSPIARGRTHGELVVLADITERKRAEEALARNNQHLRALVESTRIVSSGLDLPRVLQTIAEEAARLVSGEPGGIGLVSHGHVVFDSLWIDGEWRENRVAIRLGEGAAGRTAATAEAQVVNDASVLSAEPLGSYAVPGFVDIPIVGRAGTVTGVLHVRRRPGGRPFDDGDRRLLESLARQAAIAIENASLYGAVEEKRTALEALYERERRLSASLQALSQTKTNFMIVTSHEMRTPLTVLRGYHELLEEGALGAEAGAEAIRVCRRTIERMVTSLEDILEMLRLDEGRVRLQPCRTDLAALAGQVADELKPFLDRRNQHVVVEPAAGLEANVDPRRVRLVLQNLLENAVKFTPDGGAIRVSMGQEDGSAHVVVQDEGVGIDPAELERIFESFYTGGDALHHRSGQFEFEARGAGLGLSIVRAHVQAHGGRTWAESAGKGQGSRFHVVLPSELPAAG